MLALKYVELNKTKPKAPSPTSYFHQRLKVGLGGDCLIFETNSLIDSIIIFYDTQSVIDQYKVIINTIKIKLDFFYKL